MDMTAGAHISRFRDFMKVLLGIFDGQVKLRFLCEFFHE